MTVDPLTDEEVAGLDPGIRDLVLTLQRHGFETTDSGDGVSKPADWYESGCAIDFAHVWITIDVDEIVPESIRCQDVVGDKWTVEATYQPLTASTTILVRPRDERENI